MLAVCKKNLPNNFFLNATVGLYVLYNIHAKFCANQMIFTIQSISLFFKHNFKIQKLKI